VGVVFGGGCFAGYSFAELRNAEARISIAEQANKSIERERIAAASAARELSLQAGSLSTIANAARSLDARSKSMHPHADSTAGCLLPDDVGQLYSDRLKNRNAAAEIRSDYDARQSRLGMPAK
jgi:hypothetical protein